MAEATEVTESADASAAREKAEMLASEGKTRKLALAALQSGVPFMLLTWDPETRRESTYHVGLGWSLVLGMLAYNQERQLAHLRNDLADQRKPTLEQNAEQLARTMELAAAKGIGHAPGCPVGEAIKSDG